MTDIGVIGTYLPPWEKDGRRIAGPDEDALTMAVAAGRAADPSASARRVVMVSRNFPLLEGGNGAVLLAGLSLPADVPVAEVLGGGPAVLDQIVAADEGTLVIAADDSAVAVGSAAVLTGATGGATLAGVARQNRSLPLQSRRDDGSRRTYVDPRLQREAGVKASVKRLRLEGPTEVAVVSGVAAAQLGSALNTRNAFADGVVSASGVIRLIADAVEQGAQGLVLGVEQATITAARLTPGPVKVNRDEASPRPLPTLRTSDGPGIPISLAAYARAFEPKLRWEAAVFEPRPGIDETPLFPPRARVDAAGGLSNDYRLQPLPRTGTVYTHATVRIPVPDLPSPYTLAVVQLDDSPVRALLKVTGMPAGEATIGQPGSIVLRRIATRTGIPDYGYMFWPGKAAEVEGAVV
ncbi:DUF35 domain-containing protein [Mycobacterium colombiense]|uniref:ChsH2 C-terminal OB-fold domain-containing protein n=1 Tax=Mycobacterium colombiense CECT 3035 TaxID=1041522 RepID=J5ECQ2_9MYCO|nr:OB-fold domain-containing protein [Mycobacterium colombiense]EJO89511.1 hypothetical protein MCOL_V204960 [Mycobacterium colombiense CECT 3035]